MKIMFLNTFNKELHKLLCLSLNLEVIAKYEDGSFFTSYPIALNSKEKAFK